MVYDFFMKKSRVFFFGSCAVCTQAAHGSSAKFLGRCDAARGLKICFNAAQSAVVATKEWKFCAPERAFWQQMFKFWQILAKLDEKYPHLHKNIEFCSKTLVFDFDLHPKHPPNFLDIIGH